MDKDKNIVLLTGSIDIVHINTPFTRITDLSERLEQYLSNIRRILLNTHFDHVIFCENTGYDYDYTDLFQIAQSKNKTLEILPFKGDEAGISRYGKGYGEGEIINYAIAHSQYLGDDSVSFYKLTGRIFIKNINTILRRDKHKRNIFLKTLSAGRPAVETVFFKINIGNYKRYLSGTYVNVHDTERNYLEHAYYHALIDSPIKVECFSIVPALDGVSGSNGEPYNIPPFKYFKRSIRLIKGSYNIRTKANEIQTTLIYEPYGTGHRPEYIRNILKCIREENNSSRIYIFALNQSTINDFGPDYKGIANIALIPVEPTQPMNVISGSFNEYRTIRHLYKDLKFDNVLLIDLYPLTWAIILKRHRFNISGILYKPFNPDEKNSFTFRFSKQIQYFLLSGRKRLKRIFILNNPGLRKTLNDKFRTNKFTDLIDPVPFYKPNNINPYPETDRITGLHFGSLDTRKGTTTILESLSHIPLEIRQQLQLAFIGRPTPSYKTHLENLLEKARIQFPEISFVYNPAFVSDSEMEDYYQFADYVLLPYQHANMSSGVLGHATRWNKFLIGNKGLVGDLIEQYQLGLAIYPFAVDVASAICRYITDRPTVKEENARRYIEEHSVDVFFKTLFHNN